MSQSKCYSFANCGVEDMKWECKNSHSKVKCTYSVHCVSKNINGMAATFITHSHNGSMKSDPPLTNANTLKGC